MQGVRTLRECGTCGGMTATPRPDRVELSNRAMEANYCPECGSTTPEPWGKYSKRVENFVLAELPRTRPDSIFYAAASVPEDVLQKKAALSGYGAPMFSRGIGCLVRDGLIARIALNRDQMAVRLTHDGWCFVRDGGNRIPVQPEKAKRSGRPKGNQGSNTTETTA